MGRAEIVAREYDGSHNSRTNFMSAANSVRRWAARQFSSPGMTESEIIDSLAQQARPNDSSVFSLDALYDKARKKLRGADNQESPYEVLLATVKRHKGTLDQQKLFPVTGTHPNTPTTDKDGRTVVPPLKFYEPRLGTVIDELAEHYSCVSNLTITTGPYSLPRDLKGTYVVVGVKGQPLKIAVSDDAEAPVYFSRSYNAEFWKTMNLQDSSGDTVMRRLGNLENLRAELHKFVKPETLASAARLNRRAALESPVVPARPLPKALPLVTDKTTLQRANDLLVQNFEQAIKPAPVSANKDPVGNRIFTAVLKYCAQNKCFPSLNNPSMKSSDVATWTSHEEWLLSARDVPLGRFIKEKMREEAQHYAATNDGRMPDETSGPLPSYPDYDFALLDLCCRAYPAKPTLGRMLNGSPVAPAPVTEVPALVVPSFKEAATAMIAEVNPSKKTTFDLSYEEKLKLSLDYLSAHRKFIFKLPDQTNGAAFLQDWIVEQVLQYRKDHNGENPQRNSGLLKDSAIDWATIDDAIYERGRNSKMTLETFIVKRVDDPAYARSRTRWRGAELSL